MTIKLPAFKAYDIRGKVPSELNPPMAYWLGRGFAEVSGAKTVVLGMDSRLTSPALLAALARGLQDAGVQVQSIGLCGTEEIYFATGHYELDLGIMVTASHNPIEYNGMKIIRAGGLPFTIDDLNAVEVYTRAHKDEPAPEDLEQNPVELSKLEHRPDYINKVLEFVDVTALEPLKLVINAGNGAAGPTADALLAKLPFEVVRIQHEPDGTFPHGIPNPLLPTNRQETITAMHQHGADLGIAWDGDFDRCFLFDETGAFVPPYYLVGLITESMLEREPGATVVYDPRLYWDTQATLKAHGGKGSICKVGHAFFKQAMRDTAAVFGGEISAHFYYRDFFCCDSGMISWLLVAQLMSRTGKTLSALVADRRARVSALDETNFKISRPAAEMLAALENRYPDAQFERVDGLGISFPEWRANVRLSSNEPLLRLNLEAKTPAKLEAMRVEICALLEGLGAQPTDH